MNKKHTTDELVKSVRRRISLPTANAILTEDEVVAICTDELQNYLVPKMMATREEYFVRHQDFVLSDYRTEQEIAIPIPYDAIGSKLRDVCIKTGSQFNPIPRMEIEDLYRGSFTSTGYYIEDSFIKIYPVTINVTEIRIYYFARPQDLILTTRAAIVREIREDNRIIVSRVPSHFSVGDEYSLINSKQPFNIYKTVIIEEKNGTLLTLDDTTGIQVGTWLCLQGESPVPQVPVEAHSVLAQMAAVKCLESMGDQQGMVSAQAKLDRDLESLFVYIGPRVDSAPVKIVGRHSPRGFWRS
jgi:hypothetical protein